MLCILAEYFNIYLRHYSTFMVPEIFILSKLLPHSSVAGKAVLSKQQQSDKTTQIHEALKLSGTSPVRTSKRREAYADSVSEISRSDQWINNIKVNELRSNLIQLLPNIVKNVVYMFVSLPRHVWRSRMFISHSNWAKSGNKFDPVPHMGMKLSNIIPSFKQLCVLE